MEYYLIIKRNEILTHAMTWMNSENIMPCLKKKEPDSPIYFPECLMQIHKVTEDKKAVLM